MAASWKEKWLFLIIFNLKCLFTNSFLNVEEINSIKYAMEILNKPVLMGQSISGPVIHLTSIYGQGYQCTMPDIDLILNTDKKTSEDEIPQINMNIVELLKPIGKGPCLIKTKDWWTYELCYGKTIQQYHLEADGKILGPVIVLGQYESDFNWDSYTEEDDTSSIKQRYHSQTYTNGSKCDLTGSTRRTEVRYLCEEGSSDHIVSVDEPESCQYVVTIHTARLCQHPYLRPLPTSKPHSISCSPVLSHSQYLDYLRDEEERQKEAEKRRKEWLAKQDERLENMKKQQTSDENVAQENEERLPEDDSPTLVLRPKDPENTKDISDKIEEDLTVDEPSEVEDQYVKLSTAPVADDEVTTASSVFKSKDTPASTVSAGRKPKDSLREFMQPEDEEDEHLLQDLEKEIDDISAETKHLAKLRSKIRNSVHAQFNDILNEAEQELDTHLKDDEKDAAYSKLADTLNKLLQKLDKTEKDISIAKSELEKLPQGENSEASKAEAIETIDQKSEDSSELLDKTEIGSNKVSVRVSRLAPGKLKNMKDGRHTQLERAIQDKLKRSGLDTGGGRVEVRVLAASYYDEEDKEFHMLSDEESEQVQTLIMSFLAGNQEAAEHIQQQHRLEENYKFVWGKQTSLSKQDEDD